MESAPYVRETNYDSFGLFFSNDDTKKKKKKSERQCTLIMIESRAASGCRLCYGIRGNDLWRTLFSEKRSRRRKPTTRATNETWLLGWWRRMREPILVCITVRRFFISFQFRDIRMLRRPSNVRCDHTFDRNHTLTQREYKIQRERERRTHARPFM